MTVLTVIGCVLVAAGITKIVIAFVMKKKEERSDDE